MSDVIPGAFLYYVPNIDGAKLSREWLRKSPLCEVLRDCWERNTGWSLVNMCDCNNGPDGLRGVVFSFGSADQQVTKYDPAHQRWVDCGTHWLGIDERFPPHPSSLQRRRIIPGEEHELNDGNVWILPIVSQPSDTPNLRPWRVALPTIETLASLKSGAPKFVEHYQAIWDLTAKIINWQLLGLPVAETPAESVLFLYEAACTLLGLNYRIGPHEADMLELFQEEDRARVLYVAIDMATVDQIMEARNAGRSTDPTDEHAAPSS